MEGGDGTVLHKRGLSKKGGLAPDRLRFRGLYGGLHADRAAMAGLRRGVCIVVLAAEQGS